MPLVRDSTLDAVALADKLRPVLLRLARELRREARAAGVSPTQVTLLVGIEHQPGIGVNDLAARERMSPAGMSQQIDRLVKATLVERRATDGDRRRVGLALTEEGRRVLRRVRSRRTLWLAQRLDRLSARELATVERAVAPLASLLGEAERP